MRRLAWVLASLPGAALLAAIHHVNPWFLDRPWVGLMLLLLPSAAVAVVLPPRRGPGRPGLGLLALALGLWAWAAWGPRPRAEGLRLLFFGMDGATFDVIDALAERGELPALSGLERRGVRAVLRSMEPMFSPLLWTTMGTGKPPEEHGIHGFRTRADDVRAPRFWEVAQAEGKRVGIYKWLVTWPPRPLDGFLVPAWLAPSPETWPPSLSFVKEIELANRLKRRRAAARRSATRLALAGIPRGFRLGTLLEAAAWKVREAIDRPGEADRRVALEALRMRMDRDVFVWALAHHRPEVASFTEYATDSLAHHFWRAWQPDAFERVDPDEVARYGSVLPDAYRQADAVLGELLGMVGPETTVLVASDHGFRALRGAAGGHSFFAPLTERLRERLAEQGFHVDVAKVGQKLAIAVLDDDTDPEAVGAALDALVDENGRPFYRWERAPHDPRSLAVTLADERVDAERIARGTVGGEPAARYVRLTEAWSGDHDPRGVFLAAGPRIPVGQRLPEADLLDVAPTILGLLDIPPAADQRGRALFGAPEGGPPSRDHLAPAATAAGSPPEGGVNEEALRSLGYIE